MLLYGNLRGIREAGKFFAFPTYFFIFSLGAVVIVGYVKEAIGHAARPPASRRRTRPRRYTWATPARACSWGLAFITLLRSFANGGSSLTGLEAISNGVSGFRQPESVATPASTLVIMSSVLAFLVLGVTLLAHWTHAVPYAAGSPTVVSQEVRYVLGYRAIGQVLFYVVQLATMLILYTGGNTSFNGFPFLANFVAGRLASCPGS